MVLLQEHITVHGPMNIKFVNMDIVKRLDKIHDISEALSVSFFRWKKRTSLWGVGANRWAQPGAR